VNTISDKSYSTPGKASKLHQSNTDISPQKFKLQRKNDVELSVEELKSKTMGQLGVGSQSFQNIMGYNQMKPMSWAKSLIQMKKHYKDSAWSGSLASNLKKTIIKKGFIMSENSLEHAVTTLATCGDNVVIGSKGGTLKVFNIKQD
jgi:hypothetical protein